MDKEKIEAIIKTMEVLLDSLKSELNKEESIDHHNLPIEDYDEVFNDFED